MICGVLMQMNEEQKLFPSTPINSEEAERIAKTKIQQKWLSYIKTASQDDIFDLQQLIVTL